jgi:uncharacterized protein
LTEKQQIEVKEGSWLVDEIPVHATLTRPKLQTPHASIILVAGSGPTDRNWCSPLLPGKNGSAELLAEELAIQGYLTLRYDKRASGPNVNENLPKMIGKISMQSHIDELSGAVETLLNEEDVERDNLFVLTNSEGAIHALNYQLQAKNKPFKGLILTGAPGRSIGEVGRSQIYNQIKLSPNTEVLMKNYDDAISDFTKGKPVVLDSNLPDGVKQLLLGLTVPANLPFSRELWSYDPAEAIAKVKAPILVIIGKKDIQVDWRVDGQELEKATTGSEAVTFVYPENADHVLKHEDTPLEKLTTEAALYYNLEDRVLDRDVVNAILSWLVGNCIAK